MNQSPEETNAEMHRVLDECLRTIGETSTNLADHQGSLRSLIEEFKSEQLSHGRKLRLILNCWSAFLLSASAFMLWRAFG